MAERAARQAQKTTLKAVPGGASGRTRTRRPPTDSAPPPVPEPPTVNTVKSAAENGTPRDLLVQLRNRIAATIDSADTPPRDLAALSRRLLDIRKEIETLDNRVEGEGKPGGAVPDESFDASAI